MAKSVTKKLNKLDKLLLLFQNKMFTMVFFLVTFGLVGGVVYFWKSSADSLVSVYKSGCTVYGRVNVSSPNISTVYAVNGTDWRGRIVSNMSPISQPQKGKNYKLTVRGVTSTSGTITIWSGGSDSAGRPPHATLNASNCR